MQQTINERLKILIGALKLSARGFSAQLEVPESNTRNYLDKNTKLNSDYLERIAIHFKSVNLSWLITGEGEPFLSSSTENGQPPPDAKIFFRSPVVGKNKGTANQQQYTNSSTEADDLKAQLTLAQQEIESLKAQLALKDTIIASKEETLLVLKAAFNRPN